MSEPFPIYTGSMLVQPYDPTQTGSMGKASMMFITDHNWPERYMSNDKHAAMDSDRIGSDHWDAVVNRHMSRNSKFNFIGWLQSTPRKKVLEFIVDMLKASHMGEWSCFRVLLTIAPNGNPIYSLHLFHRLHAAPPPKPSKTAVSSDGEPSWH